MRCGSEGDYTMYLVLSSGIFFFQFYKEDTETQSARFDECVPRLPELKGCNAVSEDLPSIWSEEAICGSNWSWGREGQFQWMAYILVAVGPAAKRFHSSMLPKAEEFEFACLHCRTDLQNGRCRLYPGAATEFVAAWIHGTLVSLPGADEKSPHTCAGKNSEALQVGCFCRAEIDKPVAFSVHQTPLSPESLHKLLLLLRRLPRRVAQVRKDGEGSPKNRKQILFFTG